MRMFSLTRASSFLAGVIFLASIPSALAQPATSVRDVLFNANGTRIQGTASISWKGFTASDGTTLATNMITVSIVQGVLSVDLVPNENTTPGGTSYHVAYQLDNGRRYLQRWVVPESASPVTVSQIRVTQPPPPGSVIAPSQVSGLVAALDGKADVAGPNTFVASQVIEEDSATPSNPLLSFREFGGPRLSTPYADDQHHVHPTRERWIAGPAIDHGRYRQHVLVGGGQWGRGGNGV